jgi:2-keto-4-pentenoate hydratase
MTGEAARLLTAQLLTNARFGMRRIPRVPPPADTAEAYRQQAEVVDAWLARLGGRLAGYKIACTNAIAQKHLGTDGPFHGRLLSATVYPSPARLDPSKFFMRVLEPEFGFRMASDLGPREQPYTREEVAAAVECVMPAIEIVDSRYDDWTTAGLHQLIVDNACHGAWVKGPESREFGDLAAHPVRLLVNGRELASGTGAAVLGHPLNALAWLAGRVALRAGDEITTGVCTDIAYAEPGDHVVADFGLLGSAEVRF